VAGLSGDSGKTLVSLGLALAARARGLEVQAFKKGPDYIDAAWLSWATERPARNLDTWLTGFEGAASRFGRSALAEGLNLVEGNRGLFDGVDSNSKHSTAGLARTLAAPVLLVVSARKMTATAAALVLGCQRMDPAVRIAAVVLNHVSGARHETVARGAIEGACGIPVLGALPRVETEGGPGPEADVLLPGRHLGLVTPSEHPEAGNLAATLRAFVERHVDVERVIEIAKHAPPLPAVAGCQPGLSEAGTGGRVEGLPAASSSEVTIGCLRDSAFSFYYPENLEALEGLGARVVPISSLHAQALPPGLDALYIGGGFPETHAGPLAANRGLLESIRGQAAAGLPIYAECGGLMLLARSIAWRGESHAMAGVLPFDVEVLDRPQGHGYVELLVDRPNPFFAVGAKLRGHEFHYSRIVTAGSWQPAAGSGDEGGGRLAGEGTGTVGSVTGPEPKAQSRGPFPAACAVLRGVGIGGGRDAVVIHNVWAGYAHLHADGAPGWAPALIGAARRFQAKDR